VATLVYRLLRGNQYTENIQLTYDQKQEY